MTLSQEAHEWNEQQKRYRENEHLHKYTAGKDHKEMMTVLSSIELALGVLIDTLKDWMEAEEKRLDDERRRSTYGYAYRTPRSDDDPPPYQTTYTPPTKTVPSTRRSGGPRNEPRGQGSFEQGSFDGLGLSKHEGD